MKEPKVAIATTTIHVPHALKLLHAHDPSVGVFVAGDTKTPEPQCADFINTLGADAYYLSVERQKSLGYACSDLIGWACIQRRNIAILEALKWGADIIVLWDDDNLPMNESYFDDFVSLLHHPFNGLRAVSRNGWFDVGDLLDPPASHRGIPHDAPRNLSFSPVTNVKIGVAAGICMGDPDISAVTRIAKAPIVHRASHLLDAGVVVSPLTRTVYNTQNSAILREFAPAMLLAPQFKRFDDILASLVTQRVMRDRGYHVHFGRPYIFQARNPHNLLRDLEAELWGMQHIERFADWLDGVALDPHASVISNVMTIYDRSTSWMPAGVRELAAAWIRDCDKVLSA